MPQIGAQIFSWEPVMGEVAFVFGLFGSSIAFGVLLKVNKLTARLDAIEHKLGIREEGGEAPKP